MNNKAIPNPIDPSQLAQVNNQRHGGPYDRGSCDAYYGRGCSPHYYEGATKMSPRVEQADMTREQVEDYLLGFEQQEDFKDWY